MKRQVEFYWKYMYVEHLEPKWPLFFLINLQNKAFSKQNKGHLGSRYTRVVEMKGISSTKSHKKLVSFWAFDGTFKGFSTLDLAHIGAQLRVCSGLFAEAKVHRTIINS